MEKRLIIIGNGFDLHHNMKTSYCEYRNYLLSIGRKAIVDCFEISCDDKDDYPFLWNRLETTIGLLPFEEAYPFLKSYSDDNWSDSFHHDFQNEIEKMSKYWPGIKDHLASWIRTIEYTVPFENLKTIINSDANYISFNYTNTLENLYGISKNKICYIHGDANLSDKLVLGHRNKRYYPELYSVYTGVQVSVSS